MRTVVVGGGLAGLAAALRLVGEGHDVTVLEARPTLGGAVQTLPERDGDPSPPPDNGQHIGLGCFTAWQEFLGLAGSAGSLDRRALELTVLDEQGRVAVISDRPLDLLRYRHLPLRDRLGIVRTLARLRKLDPGAHDGETFAAVLGTGDRVIERFWDVFIRPALNLRCAEASAALGLFTVQTALLGDKGAGDLLLPTAPLGEMHGDAAGRTLLERGAEVRLGARVVALEPGAAVLDDGERVEADSFVVALPAAESARLLGEDDPGLESSPIVSVHLLFDRELLPHPLAALLSSPAHWVFDRGALTGHRPGRGQYLTVVSSGAPELLEVRGRELVELISGELTSRLGPAEVLWSRVSREPEATVAGRPGQAARRRGAATGQANVVRAGAWTDTGWPATMESAVRSGFAAAQMLMSTRTEEVAA
ncbi:MAG: hydroxysqualene dehydroxylase HpnE [Gaiellaceae bacterium]